MELVQGVHHVTFLTDDLDRLAAFYERVFEVRKTLDMTEEGVRHVYLEMGPTTVLHPFQLIDGPPAPAARCDVPAWPLGSLRAVGPF